MFYQVAYAVRYENGGAKQIEIDLPTKVVKIGSSLTIEWFQSFALDIDLDYFSASQLIVSLCQARDDRKYLNWFLGCLKVFTS